MNIYIPPFPVIPKQESLDFTSLMNQNIPQIRSRWGSYITDACAAYGTDPNIMIGFIGIECPDLNPAGVSSAGAIGVLQMQVPTAWDYINKQAPQLPPAFGAILNKYLPGLVKPVGGFTGFLSTWKSRLEDALYQEEFNIWVGVTGLSQLIWGDIKSNKGTLRLDHVVIKYNAGGDDYSGNYHKFVITPGLQHADPSTLLPLIPLVETRAYIIKLMGIEGSVIVALRMQ